MQSFLNFTVVGIATAAVYAIAASGLVVTYTTSGIFNFAHGAVGMISAFLYWQVNAPTVSGGWGWPVWLSVIFVVFIAAPLMGALIERVIMRGLEGATEVVKIVVTVSLLLALVGLSQWIWPGNVTRSYPRFFPAFDDKVTIGRSTCRTTGAHHGAAIVVCCGAAPAALPSAPACDAPWWTTASSCVSTVGGRTGCRCCRGPSARRWPRWRAS